MQYPWSRPSPGGSREKRHKTLESPEQIFKRKFTEAMDTHHKQGIQKKSKRFRSAFTTDQVNYLEMEFQKFPYIGNAQRKEVANLLKIPERAIKIWFQNRRMKEKKDLAGNTESDEQSDRNTVEVVNDKVNSSKLSMPQISVPPSTQTDPTVTPSVNHVAHIDLSNFDLNSEEKPDAGKTNFYSDLISPLPEVSISRIPKPQQYKPPIAHSPQFKYRSSAEFSIDLCKKYKTFSVNELQTKTEDIHLQPLPLTPQRVTPRDTIQKFDYQSSPEDLSCNKPTVPKIPTPSPPRQVDQTSPELIPVYVNYPQPYLSAGNMLWKPVNVMPIMSTGLPTVNVPSIPPGPLHRAQEQSTAKKKCNCECHVEAAAVAVPLPDTSSNSQAQYVFTAIPFQSYPKFN